MDMLMILVAFVFGFAARHAGLPPLVGFLVSGFVLGGLGFEANETIHTLSDIGIYLLLFSIGLKLDLRSLARPHIWAVTSLHMIVSVVFFGGAIFLMTTTGLGLFTGLALPHILTIAFALSFSSTVFAVKIFEEKGEMSSLHGKTAIGVLIMQDIFAIVYMTASTAKIPSPWAALLLLLPLVRRPLIRLMNKAGHGELLVLLGVLMAIGSAQLFGLVGLKPDLGPLVFGVLVGTCPKATEMAGHLFGFKELFLTGFFLSLGLTGMPDAAMFVVAVGLLLLVALKAVGFFVLFTRFRLRARTAFHATLGLANYSEFGLIVGAVGVSAGWLSHDWLVTIAIALSLSFIGAAPLNRAAYRLFARHTDFLHGFEATERLPDDTPIDPGPVDVAIFGMGRVGTRTYDQMVGEYRGRLVGFDFDSAKVAQHHEQGRHVLLGDPTDLDFWEQFERPHSCCLTILALSNHRENVRATRLMRERGYDGKIAAVAFYDDQCRELYEAGADVAHDIYTEVGIGLSNSALEILQPAKVG
jgi:predicted Kef-type K+ transport protein